MYTKRKRVYSAFTDSEKFHDRAIQEVMWDVLKVYVVDEKLIME